ncbi:Protein still life, isoforms C/SIF type 2 [Araneus ventricosus]|uniref:Protein still life, isoforms C/SIF type 2 n=1 Tax=Araneus ventricosus TaxID=182803 RepID=A0A4Y2IFV7_ARAVE|nr:Protein still life, isoforms C/SIF type 2 [Araneus ventricosus]
MPYGVELGYLKQTTFIRKCSFHKSDLGNMIRRKSESRSSSSPLKSGRRQASLTTALSEGRWKPGTLPTEADQGQLPPHSLLHGGRQEEAGENNFQFFLPQIGGRGRPVARSRLWTRRFTRLETRSMKIQTVYEGPVHAKSYAVATSTPLVWRGSLEKRCSKLRHKPTQIAKNSSKGFLRTLSSTKGKECLSRVSYDKFEPFEQEEAERFLSVKKWLLRKKQQVELARKRGWKGYWVCLKGTTLLFYPCDNRDNRAIDTAPKHLIIVDGAIMQPIPEHPKRDYIFCLSTAFGDAYLFQAPCHVELENWVNSIHCACAAAFARHRGKTGTLHLLQEEIFRLEKEIESDFKMKHMAELQLTVVADAESKEQLNNQISQYEENMERLHCEQFRLRCYMSSLQNGELPNPKSLLQHVSKATKSTLNKLGVFTVSSFHAYICARSPSLLTNLLSGRGATKRRSLSRSNSGRRSLSLSTTSSCSLDLPSMPERSIKIQIPDNQTVSTTSLNVRDNMTVEEVLWSACGKKQLSPNDHFLRAKKRKDVDEYFVPPRNEFIENLINQYEVLEVCPKVLYQVELSRHSLEQLFGFSVEAELVENVDHQDELCVYVSRVEESSLAHQQGLMKGDEIMVINGAIVSDLDMMYIESVLQEELSLCMMMRSSRTEPPDLASAMRTTTDDYIESLVCPPPPGDSVISEDMIGKLIVPSPMWCKEGGNLLKSQQSSSIERSPDTSGRPTPSPVPNADTSALSVDQIDSILKTADTVTEYCRAPLERRSSSLGGASSTGSSGSASMPFVPARQLSDAEKLRKVIMELIDTERTYVKV